MAIVALTETVSTAPGIGGVTAALTQNTGLTASTNTYTFNNDGKTMLVCKKGAGACTVTLTTPGTQRGVAIADPTYTLAANTEFQVIGPFPVDMVNDSSGLASVVFSETTGLVVGVLHLGNS
jgi:hypothetical protein